jgi:beta-galactosidase beta subunit
LRQGWGLFAIFYHEDVHQRMISGGLVKKLVLKVKQ